MPRAPSRTALAFVAAVALNSCGSERDVARSPLFFTAARSRLAASTDGERDAAAEAAADAGGAATAGGTPTRGSPAWARKKPPAIETDWCIDEVNALEEGACYLLPDEPTRTLLIYFHGIVPPTKESPQKTKVETVVVNAARRAGVAALIPRGKRGLAPKGRDGWWGWPTSDPSYREHGAELVGALAEQQKKLEEIAGVSFDRVYVAGSSSGAYFATMLALRHAVEARGFAAISGGTAADSAGLDKLEPKPFYIGYSSTSDTTVRGAALALADVLRRARWPVRTTAHPFEHGAHEVYLDEAFAFWRAHDR